MPRKVVYGKKTNKTSAFLIPNDFFSCSPTKPSRPRTTTSSTSDHGTIEGATIALERLKIRNISEKRENEDLERCDSRTVRTQPKTAKTRKALDARDPNTTGPTKTREIIQQQSERTKDDTKPEKSREVSVPRGVEDANFATMPPLYTNIPDPTCDPYIAPLIVLMNEHSQSLPQPFDAWSAEISQHFRVSKIAEATYSEVYRLSLLAPHATLTPDQESVFKIIALKPGPSKEIRKKKKSGAQAKREQNMSHVESVASEVKLLKRMTDFPGFTNYRALHILKGRQSQLFIDAWKEWNDGRKKGERSEFSDPSKRASYSDDQLWAVIEMQDAGTDVDDLHKMKELNTIYDVWDIFWQVVIAIGKGEANAKFEHRDLHCGNICVRERKELQNETKASDEKKKQKLNFTNLETTIIDYTLSRAEIPKPNLPKAPPQSLSTSTTPRHSSSFSKDQNTEIIYLDLSTPSEEPIFNGTVANPEKDYQYEIYRYMRSTVYFSNPLKPYPGNGYSKERVWEEYHPQTNLVWLHYVLYQLFRGMDGKVLEGDELEWKLEGILKIVEGLLDLDGQWPREGFGGAADLVAVALREGWLDEEDVKGMGG